MCNMNQGNVSDMNNSCPCEDIETRLLSVPVQASSTKNRIWNVKEKQSRKKPITPADFCESKSLFSLPNDSTGRLCRFLQTLEISSGWGAAAFSHLPRAPSIFSHVVSAASATLCWPDAFFFLLLTTEEQRTADGTYFYFRTLTTKSEQN